MYRPEKKACKHMIHMVPRIKLCRPWKIQGRKYANVTHGTSYNCLVTSSSAFSSQKSGVEWYTFFRLSIPVLENNTHP